jgi:serine phosphatase RsbU (regulator of sigma subunit)
MDVAIFSYDPETNEFESSGAFNTIYIFKKGQMQKISGDKRPIGHNENNYTNQKLIIEPGSTVYLGTDGYADQFG